MTDREGRPVSGLQAADFELFDEGRRQDIVVFDAISRPAGKPRDPLRDEWVPVADVASNMPPAASGRAFVFVVDTNALQIVLYRRVLTKLFSLLTPDDRVAVVFPRRSDLSLDFTSDPVRVRRAIDRLTDASDGPITDFRVTRMALENAMTLLETVPLARKAIVWVSGGFNVKLLPSGRDGLDLVNPLRFAKARSIARDAIEMFNKGERLGIPIYTIDPFGLYPESTTRSELLKTASVATGGTSYVNRAFIVDAAEELMTSNDHFYVLGFAPDPFKPDGKFRQIRLRVAGRRDLRVRTRAGYVAKAPPPTYADSTEGLRAELAAGRPLDQLGMRAFAVPVGPGPSRRTRLLLTTSVEYPDLSDTSQSGDDVLTLLVLALDPDARVLASRQRNVPVPSSVLRGDARTITINESFDLPRGPVVLRIGATSSVLKGAGTVSLSVDVPRYQNTSPALSPLVLGLGSRSLLPPDSAAAGLPFQPSTSRRFPRNSRVQVFARGFGLATETVRQAPFFSVISDDVALRTIPATSTAAPAGRAGTDFSASIPLDGLAPGTYAISLVVASADGKSITQAVRIEIE